MLICGVIGAIVGIVLLIVGISQNNSIEAQLSNIFSGGGGNPGTVWIIIGIAAIAGYMKKKKN